jgi:hypothetical protein
MLMLDVKSVASKGDLLAVQILQPLPPRKIILDNTLPPAQLDNSQNSDSSSGTQESSIQDAPSTNTLTEPSTSSFNITLYA